MTWLWITAAFVAAMCIAVPAVWSLRDRSQEAAWRREDDQLAVAVRGRHRAAKPATIPRAITEHEPPWEYQAAPVIEPAAITSGPPDEPEVIITATLSIQYPPGSPPWVDDRIRTGMGVALLPPVAELLGYPSTDAAVDALAAPWHSVDSIFNGADVRQVRAKLEAGS